MDYSPPAEAVPPDPDDEAARRLDVLARSLAGLQFRADVSSADEDRFRLQLHADGYEPEKIHGARMRVRPVSLGLGAAMEPTARESGFDAEWVVSFAALTEFFAIDLESGEGSNLATTSFLITAELTGAPADRLERLLAGEIRNRSALLRLLLLLLGNLDAAFGDLVDVLSWEPSEGASAPFNILGADALLEPLMRTLSRDPARLDEIDRLVTELAKTEEGRSLLPDGWPKLWAAVSAARPRKVVAA
jgi:hypothetical protein